MKCRQVSELLVAYLDGEVTPSERTLIEAHLAGCDLCGRELAGLSATQSGVSRFLRVRAAQAAPSPQAWSRLQARLARDARPSSSWLPTWLQRLASGVGRINHAFEGGFSMKRGFALAAIAALIVGISMVSFVPSVRAQVGQILNTWFRFKTPGGYGEVAISGTADFCPLHPTYLPADFQTAAFVSTSTGGRASMELMYHSEDQFLTISQSKIQDDEALPGGQEVTVNGQAAVLVTGLEGTLEGKITVECIPEDAYVETIGTPPARPVPYPGSPGSIAYTDGKRLTWYVGDVRVEMLSNLPQEELLKVAESLVPAEAGEGEAPFRPPLEHTSDEGDGGTRVIEVDGGRITIIQGDSAESD